MELTPFGKLFSASWELYKKRLVTLATLFVLPFLASLPSALSSANRASKSSKTLSDINPGFVVAAGSAALIVGLIFLAVSLWIQIAAVYAIAGADDEPKVQDLLRKSLPLVLPLLLVVVLAGLAIIGGLILLIVPGIIFGVWFAFASYTLILDGKHGREALKSSKALVTGRWGAVFVRFLLLGLVLIGVSIVVGLVFGIFPHALREVAKSAASNFLISPLGLIFAYLLYKDLKKQPAVPAAS